MALSILFSSGNGTVLSAAGAVSPTAPVAKKPHRPLHPADATRGRSGVRADDKVYLHELFARPQKGPPGLIIDRRALTNGYSPQYPVLRTLLHPKEANPDKPCPPRAARPDRDRHDLFELTYRNDDGEPVALARFIRVVDFAMRRLPPPELDPAKPGFTLERNWVRLIDIGRRNDTPASLRGITVVINELARLARSAGAIVFTESQPLATILRRKQIPLAPSEQDRTTWLAEHRKRLYGVA